MEQKDIEVILQYRQREVDMDEVFHRIKEDYEAHGHKDEIKKQEVYVKPEDFTAYYVINGDAVGKVLLFWQSRYEGTADFGIYMGCREMRSFFDCSRRKMESQSENNIK